MENGLKVSAEKLMQTAEVFEAEAAGIRTSTSSMMEQAAQLGLVWKGAASETYISKLRALETDIERMISMIMEESRKLQEMAAVYNQAETENSELAAALTGGTSV